MTVADTHPIEVADHPPTPAEAEEITSAEHASSTGPREIGGPRGLEPTRYGDWERKGRCIDF